MLAILATSYCLDRNDRVGSFFIGLWGLNNVFSHVSLILVVATSSIFAKLLLTNFVAPFLAARESDFLVLFSRIIGTPS